MYCIRSKRSWNRNRIYSIVNYVRGTLIELKNIARSLGRRSIYDIKKEDLVVTDQVSSIVLDLPLENAQTYREIIKGRIATVLKEKNLTNIKKSTMYYQSGADIE
jgi:hypothetical protein